MAQFLRTELVIVGSKRHKKVLAKFQIGQKPRGEEDGPWIVKDVDTTSGYPPDEITGQDQVNVSVLLDDGTNQPNPLTMMTSPADAPNKINPPDPPGSPPRGDFVLPPPPTEPPPSPEFIPITPPQLIPEKFRKKKT